MGSNFTISVSCHHFGWAFPSSGKSRVHESGPIAFKTRFVKFPHRGETKKHPWDRILQFRFHATILGGLFQAAQNAGVTKVVEFRSKRVFSTFPIGAKRKNSLGIEFYNFGFMPPFWVGFSNFTISVSAGGLFKAAEKGVHESGPIAFKTRFVKFPHRGETKTPLGSDFTTSVSPPGRAFPSSQNAGVSKVVRIPFKTRFFNFPHRGEAKKQPFDRFYNFGFMPAFCVGFSKPG